jgi:hypothetical protein
MSRDLGSGPCFEIRARSQNPRRHAVPARQQGHHPDGAMIREELTSGAGSGDHAHTEAACPGPAAPGPYPTAPGSSRPARPCRCRCRTPGPGTACQRPRCSRVGHLFRPPLTPAAPRPAHPAGTSPSQPSNLQGPALDIQEVTPMATRPTVKIISRPVAVGLSLTPREQRPIRLARTAAVRCGFGNVARGLVEPPGDGCSARWLWSIRVRAAHRALVGRLGLNGPACQRTTWA